jgi:hypothetical protein
VLYAHQYTATAERDNGEKTEIIPREEFMAKVAKIDVRARASNKSRQITSYVG